jgi:hypothetical protein
MGLPVHAARACLRSPGIHAFDQRAPHTAATGFGLRWNR